MPSTLVVVALFLHNLFTAVWVGGMLVLVLAVLPAVRQALGPGPEARRLARLIQQRLSIAIYVSMAGLAVTGLPLGRRAAGFTGLLDFATPYSSWLAVKHLLVIAMIAVALIRGLVAGRKAPPTGPGTGERLNVALLAANAVLGVAVLLLTALMEAA